ncbi:MAG: hypothetical protein ACRD1F_04260, partial [Terriglobales bacterium]
MDLLSNTGRDRVLDRLSRLLESGGELDAASPRFSLFGFAQLLPQLGNLSSCRLAVAADAHLHLTGGAADRGARNQLRTPWLARECARWLADKAALRQAAGPLPQA